jgi:hypothetical protein
MTIQKPKIPLEEEEHLSFMKWAMLQPKVREVIIHYPAEIKANANYMKKRSRLGVRPGVCDFFLPIPSKDYHGLWIELKRIRLSVVSLDQSLWIFKMKENGYWAEVAKGWLEAKRITEEYLNVTVDGK